MVLIFQPVRRKMRFLPLIAATYFMVSGGPYGIEDILGEAGLPRRSSFCWFCPSFGASPPRS